MCDHRDRRQDAANTELTHKAHREVGAREMWDHRGGWAVAGKVGGCKRTGHMMGLY